MSSLNEYIARATIEERLRRADELRVGRPDRQMALGRPSRRRVRRAALRMALMRGWRRGEYVVVPASGGEAVGSPREQRVTRADGEVEHAGENAAVNGVANADRLVEARA